MEKIISLACNSAECKKNRHRSVNPQSTIIRTIRDEYGPLGWEKMTS